jgi:hypothetical protein
MSVTLAGRRFLGITRNLGYICPAICNKGESRWHVLDICIAVCVDGAFSNITHAHVEPSDAKRLKPAESSDDAGGARDPSAPISQLTGPRAFTISKSSERRPRKASKG